MKVNSISGITCYVKALSKTAEFYEAIGFRRGKEERDSTTFYVNWFFVTFIAQDREDDAELRKLAELPTKGAGLFDLLLGRKIYENDDRRAPDARGKGGATAVRSTSCRRPGSPPIDDFAAMARSTPATSTRRKKWEQYTCTSS
jgi:hypothetical protein